VTQRRELSESAAMAATAAEAERQPDAYSDQDTDGEAGHKARAPRHPGEQPASAALGADGRRPSGAPLLLCRLAARHPPKK
jgi:hypothetical protein